MQVCEQTGSLLGGICLEQGAGPRLANRLGAAGGSLLAKQVADLFFDGVQGNH